MKGVRRSKVIWLVLGMSLAAIWTGMPLGWAGPNDPKDSRYALKQLREKLNALVAQEEQIRLWDKEIIQTLIESDHQAETAKTLLDSESWAAPGAGETEPTLAEFLMEVNKVITTARSAKEKMDAVAWPEPVKGTEDACSLLESSIKMHNHAKDLALKLPAISSSKNKAVKTALDKADSGVQHATQRLQDCLRLRKKIEITQPELVRQIKILGDAVPRDETDLRNTFDTLLLSAGSPPPTNKPDEKYVNNRIKELNTTLKPLRTKLAGFSGKPGTTGGGRANKQVMDKLKESAEAVWVAAGPFIGRLIAEKEASEKKNKLLQKYDEWEQGYGKLRQETQEKINALQAKLKEDDVSGEYRELVMKRKQEAEETLGRIDRAKQALPARRQEVIQEQGKRADVIKALEKVVKEAGDVEA